MKSPPAENLRQFAEPVTARPQARPPRDDASADAAPTSQPPPSDQPAPPRRLWGQPISLLASATVHGLALLLLSLLFFRLPGERPQAWLQGAFDDEAEILELDVSELTSAAGEFTMGREHAVDPAAPDPLAKTYAETNVVAPAQLELPAATAVSLRSAPLSDSLNRPLASLGGGLAGRQGQNRRSLALAGGGTEASEAAVERGLAWLAAHQFDDGGWRFNLVACPQCGGACRDSGFRSSTTDSTGLALLCFLGAGYTHHEGRYQETVANGLYYLQQRMLLTSLGGDLRDKTLIAGLNSDLLLDPTNGNMYSHAIATLALCEAYAMTRDKNLAGAAQEAANFIVHAQHEKGGWRYEPKMPGDLSVTGWQITALKSALHGKLDVPREVWYRASDFLDGLQEDRGAAYGYLEPTSRKPTMSVVGLFSRMLLGWPRDHKPLLRGLARIAEQAPQQNHMYFNYYASQVLRHHGGAAWLRWNPRMRDYLVELQATAGHETGSWYIDEKWSTQGGRLYTTTLSILTLEVYYRYMPMYQETFTSGAP